MAAGPGPTVRRFHQWAGALFCPAIIYFGLTGLVQVYNLHKATGGVQPPALLQSLAQLHKNQAIPARRPAGSADRPGRTDKPDREEKADKERPRPSTAQSLLKAWAAAAAVAQVALGGSGLWMALQLRRGRRLVIALASAGVLVPLALALATP
jgi:hypothetical protein